MTKIILTSLYFKVSIQFCCRIEMHILVALFDCVLD